MMDEHDDHQGLEAVMVEELADHDDDEDIDHIAHIGDGDGGEEEEEEDFAAAMGNPVPRRARYPRASRSPRDSYQDDPDFVVSSRQRSTKSRKPNSISFHFTLEQEAELVEWFRDNPRFYDRKCWDYRMTVVKQKMIEKKAKEFMDPYGNPCSPAQLRTWWASMRTFYGKITRKVHARPPGATGPRYRLTDRENWILENFSFLADHIVRIKARPERRRKRKGRASEEHKSSVEEEVEEDGWEVVPGHGFGGAENTTLQDLDVDSTFGPGTSGSTNAMMKGRDQAKFAAEPAKFGVEQPKFAVEQPKKEQRPLEKSDLETFEKICGNMLRSAAPSALAQHPASPASTELENFARDVVYSMKRIPEEWWNDVKMEMMMVIRNYTRAAQSQSRDATGTPGKFPLPPPTMVPPSATPGYNHSFVSGPPTRHDTSSPGQPAYHQPPSMASTPGQSHYTQQQQNQSQQQQWQQPFSQQGQQLQRTGGGHVPTGNTGATNNNSTSDSRPAGVQTQMVIDGVLCSVVKLENGSKDQ